jgi:hypothetical protein
MRSSLLSIVLLLLISGTPIATYGQRGHPLLVPVVQPEIPLQLDSGSTGGWTIPSWLVPISSALVPGSGQILTGHDRGVLYLAAEAFLLLRLWSLEREGRRERDAFRDLAFSVARAPFRPARRDTVFEYYEAMQSYIESGPFSTGIGSEIIPPTDVSTYNGYVWQLARETFLASPDLPVDTASEEYQRALDFYASRAVGANFQWSWRDAGLERDLFRQSIGRSDDAFRLATQYLGLVLANHLVSTIDAFVSERLGRQTSLRTAVSTSPDHARDVVARVLLCVEF